MDEIYLTPTFETTNVAGIIGGDCYLMRARGTNILIDSGFGFSAKKVSENLKRELEGEKLHYILLTHSHYDHAMGSAEIKSNFSEAKIIASEYCKEILNKPTARAAMKKMDEKAAKVYGFSLGEDFSEKLDVDITLEDGEEIALGENEVVAVALPGHTKCCMGYYFKKEKILISCETLGIYVDKTNIYPGCLVGYDMTIKALKKALSLEIRELLIPHSCFLFGEEITDYLKRSERVTTECKDLIVNAYKEGKNFDETVALFKEKYYNGETSMYYPEHALMANLKAQIPMFIEECAK